jgi:membrane protein implicated in regulation of membrane protease activity
MSYAIERMAAPVFLGAVLLLLIGPVALIAVMVVALAALAALVALAGAVLALPYLLVRSLRRRVAERGQSTEGTGLIGRAIAQAGRATQQSGVAALANSTTARR